MFESQAQYIDLFVHFLLNVCICLTKCSCFDIIDYNNGLIDFSFRKNVKIMKNH